MGTAAHPAFLRGAKTLLLLRLDGEQNFGIHEELHHDHDGRAVFTVTHVNVLSPAHRAGISQGDQLLTVQVLGIDSSPFAWSDSALERLERLEEICVVQICVKKSDDSRITESQQRRHDYIAQWLTKAKMLKIATKRFRGAFILAQLQRVVVLMYDFEHDTFARLWKALPSENERNAFAHPVARAFVSESKLPGLVDDPTAARPAEHYQSAPASAMTSRLASPKMSTLSTTESQVWSHRSPSADIGKSEPPSSPRHEHEQTEETGGGTRGRQRPAAAPTHRYLPYAAHQRPTQRPPFAQLVVPAPLARPEAQQEPELESKPTMESPEDDSCESESEEEEEEEWVPSGVRRGHARVKGEPSVW